MALGMFSSSTTFPIPALKAELNYLLCEEALVCVCVCVQVESYITLSGETIETSPKDFSPPLLLFFLPVLLLYVCLCDV